MLWIIVGVIGGFFTGVVFYRQIMGTVMRVLEIVLPPDEVDVDEAGAYEDPNGGEYGDEVETYVDMSAVTQGSGRTTNVMVGGFNLEQSDLYRSFCH